MNRRTATIVGTATGAFVVAASVGVVVALDTGHGGATTTRTTAAAGVVQTPAASAVGTSASAADTSAASPPDTSPGISCTLNESGYNVEVTLNQAQSGCARIAQTLAQDVGGFWQLATQESNSTLVCAVTNNGVTAMVTDSGMHIEGSNLCREFQADGFIENLGVEQSYNGAQAAAAAAAAQASASAAAAAALASQQTADYQNATQTLSGLAQATGPSGALSTDVTTLAKDTDQAASDLTRTRNDAAAGQGDNCYGLTTVYYDAVDTVGYDENDTLSYDLKALTTDIADVRSSANALSSDATTLQNEGVTPPPGISDAISAAQKAVDDAISKANADIDAVASDVSQAYQIQNAMVTGSCSTGDAAGNPPAPPAHLS